MQFKFSNNYSNEQKEGKENDSLPIQLSLGFSSDCFLGKALLWTKELKKDNKMLNNKASQKPATLNPLTKCSAIKIINALITNKNNPSEKIVTGSVNIINNGLIVASNIANSTATASAVKISLITIPGRI